MFQMDRLYRKSLLIIPKVMIDDRDELPAEENEEEEHVQFDIRQAIISSEILKRPQY